MYSLGYLLNAFKYNSTLMNYASTKYLYN